MIIQFYSEGGFAGLNRKFSEEVSSLPDEIQQVVKRLLAERSQYQKPNPEKSNARDMMKYLIDIQADHETIHFEFEEPNLPEELEELIHYCSIHAGIR